MGPLPKDVPREVTKSYKKTSLKVHPDKIRAAGGTVADEERADEAFIALKAAYTVLGDAHTRDLYDKFGRPGLDHKDDTTQLLATLAFFYVVWLALAYLLTQRKAVGRAQTWAFVGLAALALFEYQSRVASIDFLEDYLPSLAVFEKIELLHRLYPVRRRACPLLRSLSASAFPRRAVP
jgi:curved DNA-binding protein CbpA